MPYEMPRQPGIKIATSYGNLRIQRGSSHVELSLEPLERAKEEPGQETKKHQGTGLNGPFPASAPPE